MTYKQTLYKITKQKTSQKIQQLTNRWTKAWHYSLRRLFVTDLSPVSGRKNGRVGRDRVGAFFRRSPYRVRMHKRVVGGWKRAFSLEADTCVVSDRWGVKLRLSKQNSECKTVKKKMRRYFNWKSWDTTLEWENYF